MSHICRTELSVEEPGPSQLGGAGLLQGTSGSQALLGTSTGCGPPCGQLGDPSTHTAAVYGPRGGSRARVCGLAACEASEQESLPPSYRGGKLF